MASDRAAVYGAVALLVVGLLLVALSLGVMFFALHEFGWTIREFFTLPAKPAP
jgi:hypothetical protein